MISLQRDVYRVTESVGVVSVCAELLDGSPTSDAVIELNTHPDDPVTAEAFSKIFIVLSLCKA